MTWTLPVTGAAPQFAKPTVPAEHIKKEALMELSCQLYSARMTPDWPQIMSGLAVRGFGAVEGFPTFYDDPVNTRAMLDAAGLTMPTLHVPIEIAEGSPEVMIEIAGTLGARTVYIPWIAPEQRGDSTAHWEALADRLAALHAVYARDGLGLGWHNHEFEFAPLADGRVPMEVILTRAPSIEWEADLAWLIRGGADPLAWIEKYGDCITAVHFKDIAPFGEKIDEDGWADPGTGTVDWPAIVAALRRQSRCRYLVAEHDNPSDFSRFATQAAKAWRTL